MSDKHIEKDKATLICSKCKLQKWGITWCANQPCPSGYTSYEQDEAAKRARYEQH